MLETPVRERHGNAKMLYLVELYKREHGVETVRLDEVANWAIANGHYRPEPIDPAKTLRREMAKAMKNEYFFDEQGREVRKYHAVRKTDGEHSYSEWAAMPDADPGHMRMSGQQRRQYLLSGCRQHKLDFDSYNDNNKFGAKIPLWDYNFNPDLEELSLPTHWPMDKPDDDEEEG